MALKKIIAQAAFDALNENVKVEYKKVGDEYHLDLDGDDSTQQIEHWKGKHRIAEEHRTRAERERDEAKEQKDAMHRGAIPKADVEALENSWREKVSKAEKERDEARAAHRTEVDGLTVGQTAARLSSELFIVPDVMESVIRSRLVSETIDGHRVVRVRGADGKPSAMSLDDLKKELKEDKRYAPILLGSKAAGGAGGGSGGAGGGAGGGSGGADKKLHEMNDAERIEFAQRDPEGFKAAMNQR